MIERNTIYKNSEKNKNIFFKNTFKFKLTYLLTQIKFIIFLNYFS